MKHKKILCPEAFFLLFYILKVKSRVFFVAGHPHHRVPPLHMMQNCLFFSLRKKHGTIEKKRIKLSVKKPRENMMCVAPPFPFHQCRVNKIEVKQKRFILRGYSFYNYSHNFERQKNIKKS